MGRRIAIIHPEGNFNNNPHLSAVIERLCDKGHRVSVFAFEDKFRQQPLCDGMDLFLQKPLGMMLIGFLARYGPGRALARLLCRALFRGFKADLVIGIDHLGIIVAAMLAGFSNAPLALFSYEIFFASEAGQRRKRAEREACRGIGFAVVQDRLRGAHLSRENRIGADKLVYSPIASAGTREAETGWLRQSLGIAPERKIALVIGSLEGWSGFDRILDGLHEWPESWCLVAHQRFGFTDEEVRRLQARAPGRLFLSAEPCLTNDDLGKIMGDADLGVAIYYPDYKSIYTGLNLEYLGMASGKISTYLRYGVPVLVNRIGEMAERLHGAGAGFVLAPDDSIPGLLASIPGKDAGASERCRALFSQCLDLDATGRSLFERIDDLLAQPGD